MRKTIDLRTIIDATRVQEYRVSIRNQMHKYNVKHGEPIEQNSFTFLSFRYYNFHTTSVYINNYIFNIVTRKIRPFDELKVIKNNKVIINSNSLYFRRTSYSMFELNENIFSYPLTRTVHYAR